MKGAMVERKLVLNRQKEIPNKLIRFTLRIIKIRDRRVKRHIIISEHVTKGMLFEWDHGELNGF